LTAARANPEAAFPIAVYIAKARTLAAMNDTNNAKVLLTESLQQAKAIDDRMSEAEIYISQARIAQMENARSAAEELLQKAVEIAKRYHLQRILSSAEAELADLQ